MNPETVKSDGQGYVRQVRLAGLGVVGKVQRESGRLFDALVEEGEQIQARRQETIQTSAAAPFTVIKDTTLEQIGKLQQLVEASSARTLHWLGLPSHVDIQALSQRVEEIHAGVQELMAARKSQPRARSTAGDESS